MESYGYNGLRARVTKTDSSGTRSFSRDGVSVLAPITSEGAANYTPGVSERRSGVTTYNHPGIKNTAVQSDSGQNLTATRRYDAFGNVEPLTGSFQGPFGYAGGFGYHADADSGLQQVGHRYYDPSLGRFLTRDRAKAGGNWYVYCDNNPVAKADPDGRDWRLVGAIGGAIVGGLLGGPGGAVAGAGIGGMLGSLADGNSMGEAVIDGATDAVLVYVGGKLVQAGARALAGRAVRQAASRILSAPVSKLQHVFSKHGGDFGVGGAWNKHKAAEMAAALAAHMQRANKILCSYRGQPAIAYVDPRTGLTVFTTPGGDLITGFRLGPKQLQAVLRGGNVS